MPSDEHLVAYLDGALTDDARQQIEALVANSPEASARMSLLRNGDRPFRDALDAVLPQAPLSRLMAGLDQADPRRSAQEQAKRNALSDDARATSSASLHAFPEQRSVADDTPPPPAAANDQGGSTGWAPLAAAAAILVALFGGFMGGLTLPQQAGDGAVVQQAAAPAQTPTKRGWRQAVADYQILFNEDSLTPFQGGDSGLPLANAALGLPLDGVATDLADLNFRRVQVLGFNGKKLVQVAYLAAEGAPVSFCIIASGKPDAGAAFETRNDLGIVHWIRGGYGFMLIGDVAQDRLRSLADEMTSRVGI